MGWVYIYVTLSINVKSVVNKGVNMELFEKQLLEVVRSLVIIDYRGRIEITIVGLNQ